MQNNKSKFFRLRPWEYDKRQVEIMISGMSWWLEESTLDLKVLGSICFKLIEWRSLKTKNIGISKHPGKLELQSFDETTKPSATTFFKSSNDSISDYSATEHPSKLIRVF